MSADQNPAPVKQTSTVAEPSSAAPPPNFADYVDMKFLSRARERLHTKDAEDLARKLLSRNPKNAKGHEPEWFAPRCQLIVAMALQDLAAADPAETLVVQRSPKEDEALFQRLADACHGLSDILDEIEAGGSAAEYLGLYLGGPVEDMSDLEAMQTIGTGITGVSRLLDRLHADARETRRLAELAVQGRRSTKQRHRQNRQSSAARSVFLRHLVDLYRAYTGQIPKVSKTETDNRDGTIVLFARELIQKVEPHWNIGSLANDLQAIVKIAKLEKSLPPFLAD